MGRWTVRWHLYSSEDRLECERVAITLGWEQNKVQVKWVPNFEDDPCNTKTLYYVEPFEDCDCPRVIRYENRLLESSVVPLESTESNDRAGTVQRGTLV